MTTYDIVEILSSSLLVLASVMLIPIALLSIQICASLFHSSRTVFPSRHLKVAVLVPAHDEASSIQRAIGSIRSQLPPGGRLLVVADNCADNTARLARAAGAEVIERQDTTQLGKGYALDFGMRVLAQTDPPDVLVCVDADCELGTNALEMIAQLSFETQRPVQAQNVMQSVSTVGSLERIAQFAWRVKTYLRPLGFRRLGLPCQLMGTGMALPWRLIGVTDLATGHLAEDQKLGADLALVGGTPIFCPEAQVSSWFPTSKEARSEQRTRWEHGHLTIIKEYLPRLLIGAIYQRSLSLLAFALDLCVPPLSLVVLLLILLECITFLWFRITNHIAPFSISSASMVLLGASIGVAWWCVGREMMQLRDILATAKYCALRIPSFVRFFTKRQVEWIRTER
jgi:cellulose synthase/poly-beta-1,6-N-acetylglucosamine synthase-like glycosyltransferase